MSLEELERRLEALEDLEAIKKLKARYAQVCDDRYNLDEMAELFTDDAEFVQEAFGKLAHDKGKNAIIKFFAETAKTLSFAVHYFLQPYIEVTGNQARGHWYLWMAATTADGQCEWWSGVVNDKYEKVDGQWLIAESRPTIFFRAPYGKGWQ
jgi:hypothetical protein